METKIKNFTDLNAWKEAHILVLSTYKITEKFPKKENFVLVNQMLRAAISITSNLAEGFGRQGLKEKIQFYAMSQASLTELQNQFILAKDLKYISISEFEEIQQRTILIHKLITGLIKSLRRY